MPAKWITTREGLEHYEARPLAEFAASTPRAAALPSRVLSLPIHPGLSDDDAGAVIEAIQDFARTA